MLRLNFFSYRILGKSLSLQMQDIGLDNAHWSGKAPSAWLLCCCNVRQGRTYRMYAQEEPQFQVAGRSKQSFSILVPQKHQS